MKYIFLVLILLLVLTIGAFAQPDTLWTKTVGTPDNSESGHWIQQTDDGGFIITGYYWDNVQNVLIMKTDSNGVLEWQRDYGGEGYDIGHCVQQTTDGGYIIVGEETSFYVLGTAHVYLIKTDMNGDSLWTKSFANDSWAIGYYIHQTVDGGYIIGGSKYVNDFLAVDAFLLKTDSLGNTEWENTYGYNYNDRCYSVQQTLDGGYILVGMEFHYQSTSEDIYLVKTDSQGNIEWERYFGGEEPDCGRNIQLTDDGGYIIAGWTCSFPPGSKNVYLIKVDSHGIEEWSRVYVDSMYDEEAMCIQQTEDGGYIASGISTNISMAADRFVFSVIILRVSNEGTEIWTEYYGDCAQGYCIQKTEDSGFIASGDFGWQYAPADVYLIRLNSESSAVIDIDQSEPPSSFHLNNPYPNPFNSSTVISFELRDANFINLTIYDIAGREAAKLVDGYQTAGLHSVVFDGTDLASGIYFAKLQAGNYTAAQKLLLLK